MLAILQRMPIPTSPVGRGSGLARDIELLDALADAAHERRGLRLSALARATGREKSQVSRAITRLLEVGLVTKDPLTQELALGWRLYELAARTAEARLVAVARPVMQQVVIRVAETVHLCVLRGTAVLTLHSELPQHGFRGLAWVGMEVLAPATSAGRVLVSDWSPDRLAEAFPDDDLRSLPDTVRVRSVETLVAETESIRRLGFGRVDEEFEPGLVGASAPIRDFRGTIVAALNVAAPKQRVGDRLDRIGHELVLAARSVTAAMGGAP